MNWKMNYWTLLFGLAVLGFAYQRFTAGQSQKPEIKKLEAAVSCPDSTHYVIADAVASQRMQRYNQGYASKVKHFAADSCNVLNGDVLNFGISKCELQAMVHSFSMTDSVTAWLGLVPGNAGARDTIDLFFQVDNNLAPTTIVKYYDFTKPCPPCPE
jgi:hypothetical protein